jgi:uncharacterized protein
MFFQLPLSLAMGGQALLVPLLGARRLAKREGAAMGLSFFPRTVKFFDLFEQQNQLLKEASVTLESIFRDFTSVPTKCQVIHQLEARGNTMSREISSQLSATFITPLDREDIHEINIAQEDILNMLKATASRVGLYHFRHIERTAVELVENVRIIVEETEQMLKGLRSNSTIEQHVKTVARIRNESELHLLVALGELYESAVGNHEALLDVIKWTQIYDRIEQSLGKSEVLATTIERVSIKNG